MNDFELQTINIEGRWTRFGNSQYTMDGLTALLKYVRKPNTRFVRLGAPWRIVAYESYQAYVDGDYVTMAQSKD